MMADEPTHLVLYLHSALVLATETGFIPGGYTTFHRVPHILNFDRTSPPPSSSSAPTSSASPLSFSTRSSNLLIHLLPAKCGIGHPHIAHNSLVHDREHDIPVPVFQPLVAPLLAFRRRSVWYSLQEIIKLGERGEGVFTCVEHADVKVRGSRGGFTEGRCGFVDVEVRAELRNGGRRGGRVVTRR